MRKSGTWPGVVGRALTIQLSQRTMTAMRQRPTISKYSQASIACAASLRAVALYYYYGTDWTGPN
jgi:hypothetical protein